MHVALFTSVRCAHAMASESAISDHVMAPELPKPNATTLSNLSQHFTFPTHISSSTVNFKGTEIQYLKCLTCEFNTFYL